MMLLTSFSGHVNYETGEVEPTHRARIESILAGLRGLNKLDLFCAIEHEGWRINPNIPESVGVKKDLAEIDESDTILTLIPNSKISEGIAYESGYAHAKGKQLIIAQEVDDPLKRYFFNGIVDLGHAVRIAYTDTESLVSQVDATVL